MQGWFIDPSGKRSLLVAGDARAFSALVDRKLKDGWSRAEDSPDVPPPPSWDAVDEWGRNYKAE